MQISADSVLNDLLNTGIDQGIPILRDYVFGKPQATPEKVLEERIMINNLNGSGPNNPEAAKTLPLTFEQQISGKTDESPAAAVASSGGGLGFLTIAALAVGGLFVWSYAKR